MSFETNSHRFEVLVDDIRPDPQSIYPIIIFTFRFSNKSTHSFQIINPIFNFRISKQGRWRYLGRIIFEDPSIELHGQRSRTIKARLILDPYGLKKIEEFREKGDIGYSINCKMTVLDQNSKRFKADSNFEGEIAKSTWVEKFLPAFGYKEVILLEIPKLNFPEFKKISDHLNDAWKTTKHGRI